MNGAHARICGWLATLALFGAGCGQILGLDEYVLVDPSNGGAGGAGGSVPPACGDGILDPDESCDDGNQTGSDGCTSCSVDACYTCKTEAGSPSNCLAKPAGDICAAGLCDGAGQCVECLVNQHCSVDGYCFDNTCKSCDDGLVNGDETDMDCGGAHCAPCSQGKTCLAGTDCKTTFCVDGVCCGEACDIACVACNIDGLAGECAAVEKYGEDLHYGMSEACLASEGEACPGLLGPCLKALGRPCASSAECASTRCADPDMDGQKTCIRNVGDTCTLNVECYSNNCMNGFCAAP